jgi:glutathione transport system substrate-binding protein
MRSTLAPLAAAFALGAGSLATPAFAAKDVVAAVASTFTTMDPYDANDTLSQAVVKSFYQGLFGFDKGMKMVPVLAESYQASKDGLVYTVKLKKGIRFHDGTDFNAEAVKANFDRVTNPENKLKRFVLYKNIAKTEVVDAGTVKFTLHEPFSPFINSLAHPSGVIISPAALKEFGSKGIAQHPVGTGPFKFVEWKPSDYLKVAKWDGYWRKGYPKVDTITWRPVVDNNSRSAMMQTGEAQFTFPVPYEQAEVLKTKPNLELVAAPSIVHRYMSMNTMQKPFDNVKVREAINYAINKEALAKVAFSGYAIPAEGVIPKGVEYAVKLGPWPYDPAKARALLKEAGYPNGFETQLWSAYNHSTAQKVIQFLQQQLAQVGIKASVQALEAGQRVEKVESAQDPASAPVRLYYVGWSSSTGESDWALRPLLAGESMPPKLFNTAYYKNPAVDEDIQKALNTTDPKEKTRLYTDAQKRIWADAPWAFLVTEQLLSATSKKLSGFYVMPDASFNFDEVDLKP